MPFKKGQSGNPTGKPKGVKNKMSTDLRETITDFLENNFLKITKDFESLKPHERAKLYTDLLQYALPKLQAVSNDISFDKMTEAQLDAIIDKLKQDVLNEQ